MIAKPMEHEKLTIEEIAKRAGVSRATVSRVIQGHNNVNVETKRIVLATMKECNYRPNRLAASLVKGKINFVGLVVGDIRNPYFAEIARAVEDTLHKNGYMAVLCDSDQDAGREKAYINMFGDFGFAGVIMTSATESKELIAALKELNCPVILVNRHLPSYEMSVVSFGNRAGGSLAMEHLISLGHRKIAILAGPENSTASQERLQGFLDAMRAAGIEVPVKLTHGDLRLQSGHEFAREVLAMPKRERPTAICVGNDTMAQGLIAHFSECGVDVPKDISVVGFDDISSNEFSKVPLTTIKQPQEEMGRAAAKMLLEYIRDEATSKRKIVFEPSLVVRQSTCTPKGIN